MTLPAPAVVSSEAYLAKLKNAAKSKSIRELVRLEYHMVSTKLAPLLNISWIQGDFFLFGKLIHVLRGSLICCLANVVMRLCTFKSADHVTYAAREGKDLAFCRRPQFAGLCVES